MVATGPRPAPALGSSRSSRPSPLREGRHGPDQALHQEHIFRNHDSMISLFSPSPPGFSPSRLRPWSGRVATAPCLVQCRALETASSDPASLSRRSKPLWLQSNFGTLQSNYFSRSCQQSRIQSDRCARKHQLRSRTFDCSISPGISPRFLGKKHEDLLQSCRVW